MTTMLEDMSREALIAAFEANKRELLSSFRLFPQAEVYDGPDILWTITSLPCAWLNNVYCARLEPEGVAGAMETAVGRAASRSVPLLWSVGPRDTPANLGRQLVAHGFGDVGTLSIMALHLPRAGTPHPPPRGFVLEQVADKSALSFWSKITAMCFEFPTEAVQPWEDFWPRASEEMGQRHVSFVGKLDGEIVATSAVFLAGGVAGVYFVATLPEARGQGIGTAMTLAACAKLASSAIG